MGIFSKFEHKVEDGVEGAASALEKSDLSPVQITKKAEKQMRREKMVGNGRQIAPTLYTCLVSEEDDERLFGYYPTLAGEVETYLEAKAQDNGYSLDCKPLVRFVPDPDLKRGKFDVIAELVAPQTIAQLRKEENDRYGITSEPQIPARQKPVAQQQVPQQAQQVAQAPQYNPRSAAPVNGGYAQQINSQLPNVAPAQAAPQVARQVPQQVAPQAPQVAPAAAAAVPAAASVAASIPSLQQQNNISGIDVYNSVPAAAYPARQVPFEEERTTVMSQAPAAKQMEVYLYDEENDIAYKLTGDPQRIGRESQNEIVISDINASRVHAEIHMEPNGTWIIADLGSTNGLYVNGRRVKSAPLNDADIVLIGTTRLEFQNL